MRTILSTFMLAAALCAGEPVNTALLGYSTSEASVRAEHHIRSIPANGPIEAWPVCWTCWPKVELRHMGGGPTFVRSNGTLTVSSSAGTIEIVIYGDPGTEGVCEDYLIGCFSSPDGCSAKADVEITAINGFTIQVDGEDKGTGYSVQLQAINAQGNLNVGCGEFYKAKTFTLTDGTTSTTWEIWLGCTDCYETRPPH